MSFTFSVFGRPFTRATLLMPNDVCSSVYLYSWLMITFAIASLLRSITTRVPSLPFDSLFTWAMPSITLSFTSWPMRSHSESRLTWYGTSVMMMVSRPLAFVSTCSFPRSTTLPRPKCMAAFTPSMPYMIPPVGKSGALMYCIISSTVMSRFSIYATQPSITSERL